MNVLDENIPVDQRQLLRGWKIRTHQIGQDVGRQGMKDDQIIPVLLHLRRPTFFTRDLGFYRSRLCHERYCLVSLAVGSEEAASFIRRTLRHPQLNTHTKRMNKVVEVHQNGVRMMELYGTEIRLVTGHLPVDVDRRLSAKASESGQDVVQLIRLAIVRFIA